MHILKGYHRTTQGLLERSTIVIERTNAGFRGPLTGEAYKAQEYKDCGNTVIEIISTDTDTDQVYSAFLPDAGECERIGMAVA